MHLTRITPIYKLKIIIIIITPIRYLFTVNYYSTYITYHEYEYLLEMLAWSCVSVITQQDSDK